MYVERENFFRDKASFLIFVTQTLSTCLQGMIWLDFIIHPKIIRSFERWFSSWLKTKYNLSTVKFNKRACRNPRTLGKPNATFHVPYLMERVDMNACSKSTAIQLGQNSNFIIKSNQADISCKDYMNLLYLTSFYYIHCSI